MAVLFVLFFILTINYSQQYKQDIDCQNGNNHGITYNGTKDVTSTNVTCRIWNTVKNNNQYYPYSHNYCRNPDNSTVPWCYADIRGRTEKQNCTITYCGYLCPDINPVPHMIQPTNLDKHRTDDHTKTVTFQCVAGYTLVGYSSATCVYVPPDDMGSWNSTLPTCSDCRLSTTDYDYKGHIKITRSGYKCKQWSSTKYSSQEQNYCRTPPEDKDNGGGPWCYTVNAPKPWEYCNVPICGAITCSRHLLNIDPNVMVNPNTKRYTINQTVTMTCKYGYIGTSTTATCTDMIVWSGNSITCTHITCSQQSLNTDPNVVFNPNTNSSNYNQSVTMTCKPGYTGTSAKATCTAINVWSRYSISCAPITCSRQSLQKNPYVIAKPDTKSYNYNLPVTLTCKPGYIGTTDTVACKAINIWSGTSITCTPTCTRQSLNITDYVTISPRHETYTSQTPVTMTCKPGYNGHNITSQCTDRNIWSKPPPTCILITCRRDALKINQTVMITPHETVYNFNQSVTLDCRPGYTGQSVTSRCLHTNQWSGNHPACDRVPCPPLKINVYMVKLSQLDGYLFGDEVPFRCDPGYKLLDGSSPVLKCDVDIHNKSAGSWNDTQPSCSVLHCPDLILPEHLNVVRPKTVGSYSFQETVYLQCENGFIRNGSPNTTCVIGTSNSIVEWNSTLPSCEAVSQQSPNVAAPVGGAVGGIVLLVIIVGAVVFFKRM